jgi:hypothetical protein
MAILKDSGIRGRVTSLLVHGDSAAGIATSRQDSARVSFAGFEGDSHTGLTRASCVRVKRQYPIGTPIRNTRQISIVSDEELALIAQLMGVDALAPEWLGANISVAGIPAFTTLPPSSRLLFDGGVSLVIDMENEPCAGPAEEIERRHPDKGRFFVKHAMERRGVTAWVEREGVIQRGDSVEVHMPPLRPYQGPVEFR